MLLAPSSAALAHVLEPRLGRAETYTETFTFILDAADGTYVHLQLLVSNAGPGDANAGCRLLVAPEGGATFVGFASSKRDAWNTTAQPPTLNMEACSAMALPGRSEVRAQVGGARLELVYAASMARLAPPGATLQVGKHEVVTDLLIPWSAVDGALTLPDGTHRALRGHGFADHARGEALPGDVATRWFRFRSLGATESFLLLAREPAEGGPPRGWVWRQAEPAPVILEHLELEPVTRAARAPTWKLTGRAGGAPFAIQPRAHLYRYAPVEEYGFLGVLARAVVGNPVTHTIRAVLTDRGEATSRPGLLEVQLVK